MKSCAFARCAKSHANSAPFAGRNARDVLHVAVCVAVCVTGCVAMCIAECVAGRVAG